MPHAIPQTHSASYPHRSMWTKCPVKFLVPRRLGNFHFSFLFSHDIEKQIWILLFVFRFRLTLKNAFELRFSFSHHFEKRIWISFFVFTSLWKTDLNFVFVWLVIWKTDLNFVCCYCTTLEKQITAPVIWSPRTPPRGLPGNSLFMQRKATEFSPPRGQSEWWTPPPPWYVPHTRYSF